MMQSWSSGWKAWALQRVVLQCACLARPQSRALASSVTPAGTAHAPTSSAPCHVPSRTRPHPVPPGMPLAALKPHTTPMQQLQPPLPTCKQPMCLIAECRVGTRPPLAATAGPSQVNGLKHWVIRRRRRCPARPAFTLAVRRRRVVILPRGPARPRPRLASCARRRRRPRILLVVVVQVQVDLLRVGRRHRRHTRRQRERRCVGSQEREAGDGREVRNQGAARGKEGSWPEAGSAAQSTLPLPHTIITPATTHIWNPSPSCLAHTSRRRASKVDAPDVARAAAALPPPLAAASPRRRPARPAVQL